MARRQNGAYSNIYWPNAKELERAEALAKKRKMTLSQFVRSFFDRKNALPDAQVSPPTEDWPLETIHRAIDLMAAGAINEIQKEAGQRLTEGALFDPEESKDLKACIDALSLTLRRSYTSEKKE